MFPIRTENQNQASYQLSPLGPHEISVLIELTLGHLHYGGSGGERDVRGGGGKRDRWDAELTIYSSLGGPVCLCSWTWTFMGQNYHPPPFNNSEPPPFTVHD